MDRRGFLALLAGGAAGGLVADRLSSPDDRAAPAHGRIDERSLEVASSGLRRIIWSVETDSPLVGLTFDDGPDPRFTPRILDILERHGVAATFMAMGHNAERHPGLLRDIAARGHEIGSHGFRHLNQAEARLKGIRREIEHGTAVIEDALGKPVTLFRPPYGRFSENSVRLLALRNLDLVLWSVTRGDLGWTDPHQVGSYVSTMVAPGDIIDLHDGLGRGTFTKRRNGALRLIRRREVEVEALDGIVSRIKARGLLFGTVSDLIAAEKLGSPT